MERVSPSDREGSMERPWGVPIGGSAAPSPRRYRDFTWDPSAQTPKFTHPEQWPFFSTRLDGDLNPRANPSM